MKAKYETERTKNARQMRISNGGRRRKDNAKGNLKGEDYHGGLLQKNFSDRES